MLLEVNYNCSRLETLCDVIKNETTKLVIFLRWFNKTYCCEYSEVYMSLFVALDLESPYRGEWTLMVVITLNKCFIE